MTDPTERLAEALDDAQVERFVGPLRNCEHGRPTTRDCYRCDAADLVVHGFGHREDHVREFAEWYKENWSDFNWVDGPPIAASHYLASLAAKEEER